MKETFKIYVQPTEYYRNWEDTIDPILKEMKLPIIGHAQDEVGRYLSTYVVYRGTREEVDRLLKTLRKFCIARIIR